MKKGLKPKIPDDRDVVLRKVAAVVGVKLDPPKPLYGWGHGETYPLAGWRMNGNGPEQEGEQTLPEEWRAAREQGAGDCVAAAAINEFKVALTDAGHEKNDVVAKVGDVLTSINLYREVKLSEGQPDYDPVTGANDDGLEIRARLKYAQNTGVTFADGSLHKIGPYASFDPTDVPTMLFVVKHFEAVPIGMEVTQANMAAYNRAWGTSDRVIWDYVAGSPNDGGHCVPVWGRPNPYSWGFGTWMRNCRLTETCRQRQVSEGWAYLSPDRLNSKGLTYEGDPEKTLAEYLQAI